MLPSARIMLYKGQEVVITWLHRFPYALFLPKLNGIEQVNRSELSQILLVTCNFL